ncbi:hypothetical protein [Paenibacillus sp. 19GGS1-52]|uniref:hypothetical protein n=1 Tax=Paenibacillus sp. 19GGS1-52 TaxID=2758563 RepID=UPI001EFBFB47|nr:hypothetical protein [Paenibacillus sp. 19GGS1-52]
MTTDQKNKGGAHHTGFSNMVTTEQLFDFAERVGMECVVIDKDTNTWAIRSVRRLNDIAWKLL